MANLFNKIQRKKQKDVQKRADTLIDAVQKVLNDNKVTTAELSDILRHIQTGLDVQLINRSMAQANRILELEATMRKYAAKEIKRPLDDISDTNNPEIKEIKE